MFFVDSWLKKPIAKWLLGGLVAATADLSSHSSALLLAIGGLGTEWNFATAGLSFGFVVGVVIWWFRKEPQSPQNAACSFSVVNEKERAVIGELRQAAVDQHKIAVGDFLGLAFSGGGIRSATFSLGIVQALADFRVLRHVDYLSTVSGGGYIGAWLLARLKRTEATIDELEKNLSPEQSPDPNSAAWEPIQFLRAYSNYLTPQMGLFSADTWSIGGIWLRNTILIQSILILGLAGVLLMPRWLYLIPGLLVGFPVWGRVIGVAVLSIFLIFSARGLRTYGSNQTLKQWQVLLAVVVPLFVLCCYSAVRLQEIPEERSLASAVYVALSVMFSLLIVQEGGKIRSRSATEPLSVWKLLLFSMLSSVLTGAITFALIKISSDVANRWTVITGGPVAMVAAVSLVLTFHIGLLGRCLEDGQREWISRAGTWLNICAVAWLALFFTAIYAPLLLIWAGEWFWAVLPALTIGWVLSTAAGLLSAWSPKSGGSGSPAPSTSLKLVATYAPYVFVVGLLFLLSFATHVVMVHFFPDSGSPQPLFHSWSGILGHDGFKALEAEYWTSIDMSVNKAQWLGFASIALLILAGLLSRRFDVNEFSMQYFYKNRLVRCYLGAARKNRELTADRFTGFDPNDDIRLSEVARRPYPIINTSLNLVHGKRLAWQERKATSFVMTPDYCGFHRTDTSPEKSWLAQSAYRPTTGYGGKMYLGRAMAISGAAVNPNMGSFTSPATAFLMTVFNVRLGSWLGNPRNERTWDRSSPGTGIFYLLCELLGLTNEDRGFVNLSDGGHFENLGIYELVRRRCKYIIACDGSQDSAFAFEDLGNAIRECRADFGAEIKIDVSRIKPDPETRQSQTHCAVGRIKYPGIEEEGYLLYIKTSLTGDEPADVLEYQKIHPEFPHQSTADQWFTESQFESYRRLGYDIGRKVFQRSAEKLNATASIAQPAVEAFFENLSQTWYPPSVRVDRFAKHGEAFDRLAERLRNSPDLKGLAQEFYERSWSGDVESKFLYCNSLMQLMEDIYIDLNLEENFDHPDNEGWMNIFRMWWRSPSFQDAWQVSYTTFGIRFRYWCETRLAKSS